MSDRLRQIAEEIRNDDIKANRVGNRLADVLLLRAAHDEDDLFVYHTAHGRKYGAGIARLVLDVLLLQE
jgi:hypothetical protein